MEAYTESAEELRMGVRNRWSPRWFRMLQGIALSFGAPAGWLVIVWISGDSISGEIARHPALFAYMLFATMLAFSAFGYMIGRSEERLIAINQRLDEIAVTDSLTGLRNARFYHARLEEAEAEHARTGRPYAVAVIDLDHFKRINDQYGHMAGDIVLASVADAIGGTTRHSETEARIGGEEFALLLPGASGADGLEAAERVRKAIEAKETRIPSADGEITLRVTASVGVASSADLPGLSSRELYMAADEALYRAKDAGRNRTAVATGESTETQWTGRMGVESREQEI